MKNKLIVLCVMMSFLSASCAGLKRNEPEDEREVKAMTLILHDVEYKCFDVDTASEVLKEAYR